MKKWIYRPCCGGLKEAMQYKKTFNSLYDMFEYLSNHFCESKKSFSIHLYLDCLDDRIQWTKTYIVCLHELPVGYCTEK